VSARRRVLGPALTLTFALALLLGAARGARAQDAQTRLWDAAMAGDTVAIARALDDGARVDSLDVRRNPNGRRALNWAAWYDRAPAVRLLLARGAAVNLPNRTGFTALHHAAEAGSAAAAAALLAAGADPAWPNGGGETPAQVARARGHLALAERLEAAGR
jgi:ankyrin repeat protein